MNLLKVFSRFRKKVVEATLDQIATQLAKIVRFVAYTFAPGRDQFEGPPVDFTELMRAYASDGYIRQAIDKYINLMFKEGWNLVGKNEKAINYVKSRLSLMALATGVPVEQFFIGIAEDLVKYANVFLAKARVRGGFNLNGVRASPVNKKGAVGAYFRMHPSTVTINRDESGKIVKYKQSVGSNSKEFDPDDVVHIYINKEAGMAFGVPFLYAVLEDIRLLRQIEENVALMLYRHIFPFLHYKVGLNEPGKEASDEEIEALREEILNMPQDGALITSERHTIEPIRINVIDAGPYLEYFENRCFTGLGVSQFIMGRSDSSSRATADTQFLEMSDHVKAIQKVMAAHVDLNIIGELLLEGGFDFLKRPELDVDFAFNEIDKDSLIKKENHEIFKFEHNAQTWEEMRRNIGMEPVADESRLYFNMIQIPLAQVKMFGSTADTDNRNQPKNQHSESFQEASGLQVKLKVSAVIQQLKDIYEQAQGDVLQAVRLFQKEKKRKFPVSFPAQIEETLAIAFGAIKNRLAVQLDAAFVAGLRAAAADFRKDFVGRPVAPAELRVSCLFYLGRLEQDILQKLKEIIHDDADQDDALVRAGGVFDSNAYRLGGIASYNLPKAYNYAYAVAARSFGEEELAVERDGDSCELCRVDSISLAELNYNTVPAWHPYCGCKVKKR